MEKYNTIILNYCYKTEKNEYHFTECFKPFSGNEILHNEYFIKNYQDSNIAISNIDNYNTKLYLWDKSEGNTLISNIEPNFSNMVLDIIFTLYFCFYSQDKDQIKILPFWYSSFIYYIGIYTELLKNKINEVKIDISIVLNCLENKSDLSDEQNRLLHTIFSKYSFSVDINDNNSIRNGLLQILSTCSRNNSTSCKIDIDFSLFNHFIQLLENFNYKKFIYKEPCFCLAHENSEYFFSLSGDKKEPAEHFFTMFQTKIIEIVEKEFFKKISISNCRISDKTLSYGRKDGNGNFITFLSMKIKSPVSYKEYDESIYIEKKIHSFTCCERKLFAGMHLTGNVAFFCKYEPCKRCIPAINANKGKYNDLSFYAFAKDSTACLLMIQNTQKQILSTNNYNFYRCI